MTPASRRNRTLSLPGGEDVVGARVVAAQLMPVRRALCRREVDRGVGMSMRHVMVSVFPGSATPDDAPIDAQGERRRTLRDASFRHRGLRLRVHGELTTRSLS